MKPSTSYEDVTRKCFQSEMEFTEYVTSVDRSLLKENDSDKKIADLSVWEQFEIISPLSLVVNDKKEFQIGDYIYKFGKSGFTQFKIHISLYDEGLIFAENETKLIEDLSKYKKSGDDTYLVAEGITLIYSGNPIISVEDLEPIKTRVSADGLTGLNCGFYRNYSVVYSECGVKIEAFNRTSASGDWKKYKTNLHIDWSLYINMSLGGTFFDGDSNDKQNEDHYTHMIEYNAGFMCNRFSLGKGVINGWVKCHDGTWLKYQYTK